MKKLVTVFLMAVALLSTVKESHAFGVNANIQVNPVRAQAAVFNRWNRAIMCDGQVEGYTQYGNVVYAYMNRVVIYPGQYAYIYAYTNYGNPFVNARGYANCWWY